MATVVKKLSDLLNFCKENGYIVAYYKKTDKGDWELTGTDADYNDIFSPDLEIICGLEGGLYVDYKDTISVDKQTIFIMHNNYNLPKVIPCIKR